MAQASSFNKYLWSTSPTVCWALFQVPGTQDRTDSGLDRHLSPNRGKRIYIDTVNTMRQGKEKAVMLGAGSGG